MEFLALKEHPHDNLGVLRTGAAHPLPDFSGCVRTRRTRSNGGPATTKKYADKKIDRTQQMFNFDIAT